MSSFQLLSKTMQKKIWDMKWDTFTSIQDKTIPIIMETSKDVIVSSGTASGKTEAAFLPIISRIENNAEDQLKVLYISPLKALINNQFERIERLCEHSHIPVHKWHGDVSQSYKNKFVKKPSGILQITPESVESLFINRTEHIRHLFKGLGFIVIDEIHSFINTARGVQLRSLLSRIEDYTNERARIVGLSATIDNFELVKEWVNYKDIENVEIIEAKGSDKELLYYLMHFETGEDRKKPVELFEDIRELTKNQKAIIFCNSRGEVEEATVFLNRLAEKDNVGESYYAHHSSIDKKEREYVEKTMVVSKVPKTVIATSSLELGIDIGDVDIVIQVDSTFTVSSLKQRLGRSGRKRSANQMLQLYSTDDDSLVQSLAVMELILEKWIEPAEGYPIPYDIVFHQVLSICQETNGITLEKLVSELKASHIFYALDERLVEKLIRHMIENDHLEKIRGIDELIVGIEGERILRSKDFYAVFMTPEEFTVLEGIRRIGTLDKTSMLNVRDNIILAGKLWTIRDIDFDKNKVYVQKAVNGKPPRYSGGGVKIHKRIGEKMMELLCSDKEIGYIDGKANITLADLRKPYHHYKVNLKERIIWEEKGEMVFETYTGTNITRNIVWALRSLGVTVKSVDGAGRITIDGNFDMEELLQEMNKINWTPETFIKHTTDQEFFFSKFSTYLPKDIQKEMHIANEIDIKGMREYLKLYSFRRLKF
ncbi:ATP-dependent Lhr-like helicase [Cytobacillus eiseniae]|uniref:ATP-dependent Lhr-like helicase n=1 Tax=Cytobacillus eiseniae TaxID=762947 RepID=A0ABS4RFZ4_9BACI|nr:DEAD/DEAH box helicase [Cytobacillus eiseniae]MBP2241816.1 ATP-dependent Lhr-like helicase [Cytobacillus eiseniae]